jgi:hypothetical protein
MTENHMQRVFARGLPHSRTFLGSNGAHERGGRRGGPSLPIAPPDPPGENHRSLAPAPISTSTSPVFCFVEPSSPKFF